MKAVVADALNSYAVVDVDLAPPKAGEVLVRMAGDRRVPLRSVHDQRHHSDAVPHRARARRRRESWRRSAQGVTSVSPGDHVILSFIPHCGECFHCVRDEPYLCNRREAGRQPARRHHPREPQRRADLRDVVPRQHGRVRGGALDQRGPDGEGRAVPVRRPHRLRGHHRGRGRGQDRGGAPGLHGGGLGLRRGGTLGDTGRAHRGRFAHHRGRPERGEDGAGAEVRGHRHRDPGRRCAARDLRDDRPDRRRLRVRGHRQSQDHRAVHQGGAPRRDRGAGRGRGRRRSASR